MTSEEQENMPQPELEGRRWRECKTPYTLFEANHMARTFDSSPLKISQFYPCSSSSHIQSTTARSPLWLLQCKRSFLKFLSKRSE
jgi:hypothetical protein